MKLIKDIINKYALMLAVPIVGFLILWILFPGTVGTKNIPSLLKQAIAPAVLGWGVLFNMKVGNWDFSVGSEVLISSIIGGNLAIMLGIGMPGMMLLSILIGLAAGAVVGLVYYLLKIPTIIVSIGMLLIYESIGSYVFGGAGVYIPSDWKLLSTGTLFIIALLAAAFSWFLFYKTKIGYSVRAVGNNANVASVNGLNVYKVKVISIAIAGLFSGIYAMICLGTSGVQKTVGSMNSMGTCFDAMMCVFVGMSISRKGNLIASIFCGSIVMQLIKLCLMACGFPSEYNSIVIAVFVLVFMALDACTQASAAKRKAAQAVKAS